MNTAKREQRMTYLTLTDEVFTFLCSFCKYYRGSYCDNAECEHPLNEYLPCNNNNYGMEPGMDCWGFRPALPLDDTADIIGIIIEQKWNKWYWQEKDGNLIVRGRI